MKKNRVNYIKYGSNDLVVRVNGKHRSFQDEDEDRIEEIYQAAVRAKEEGSDEAVEALEDIIEPIRRYELEGKVELDRAGNAYLGDTLVPMPEALAELVISFVKEKRDIQPLINFWQLCLLNPNEHARDNFFDYVKEYGIVITDNGYVILYKALNKLSQGGLTDFSDFVGEQYLKIKRMKKSPDNYEIFAIFNKTDLELYDPETDKEKVAPVRFELSTHSGNPPEVDEEHETRVQWCNLGETYEKVASIDSDRKTVYKPWHKGKYGMDVQLGVPVKMPREECDPDINIGCSYGLHVGSYNYVSSFGRGMDSILAVLVNPRDIVALPEHNNSKIRTCEYYPYAVMERDEEGNWEELEDDYFEEDYAEEEIKDIKSLLTEMYATKYKGDFTKEEKTKEAILNSRLIELENK